MRSNIWEDEERNENKLKTTVREVSKLEHYINSYLGT